MAPLNLKTVEDPGILVTDTTFAVLRDFLEPDSTMTLESAARTIEDVLPAEHSYSTEVAEFGDCAIEAAEQIPFNHPSQMKLAGLLEYLANSPKLGKSFATTAKKIPDKYIRYQNLRESLREDLNGPDEDNPRNWVNFHAFAANLWERRIFGTSPTWAIWAQRDAHEGLPAYTENEKIPKEIYVLAGAQWIFWYGQSFFKQVQFPGEVSSSDLQAWTPGPLYDGKAHLTLDRWHFWRDGYKSVAIGDKEDGYSQECKIVAAKAAALMDSLERNMTF